jgi:TPR repeat protein
MKALANLYAIGGPVEANPTASLSWYRQAAQKGDVEGAFHTGLAYLLGVGAERNEKEALHWLKQAAKGGNGMARAFSMQIEPPPPAKRPAPASRTKRT